MSYALDTGHIKKCPKMTMWRDDETPSETVYLKWTAKRPKVGWGVATRRKASQVGQLNVPEVPVKSPTGRTLALSTCEAQKPCSPSETA